MKTGKLLKPIFLLLSPLAPMPLAIADSNQQIAVQFFPDQLKASVLREFGNKKPVDLSKYVMTVPADLDHIGKTNYLVCVYSDRAKGALRIIKTDDATPILAAEAKSVDFYGVRGGPELIDLDHDNRPEIAVGFMSARGNETTWIFRWTGSSIQLINPISPDGITGLGSVEFLDLSGTGALSVVSQQPIRPTRDDSGSEIALPTAAYSLGPKGLSQTDSFVFQGQFTRTAGPPQEEANTVAISDTSKIYTFKVVDLNMSSPDLGPLLSSAELILNGKQIVGPNTFKPGVRNKVISVPVQLKSFNTLTVKLAGNPGSKMLVVVSQEK